jgi:hypothetical protein
MKTIIKNTTVALILFFSVGTAFAQKANPHFNKKEPAVSSKPSATTLQVCGTIYGLGSDLTSITITLNASGNATTECTNNGTHQVDAQSKFASASSGAQTFPVINGHASFCLTTITPAASACVNPNWSGVCTNVDFTSASIFLNGKSYPVSL